MAPIAVRRAFRKTGVVGQIAEIISFTKKLPLLYVVAAVVLALGLAIYGTSLQNEFVLDDEAQVKNNALADSLANLGEIFRGASTKEQGALQSYGIYFRPLMIATYAVIKSTFGATPTPFHLVQLAIHLANAILLFVLFHRFASVAVALIGSLVFLSHPMNVEAVVYIAALQDPLFAVFGLGALVLASAEGPVSWRRAAGVAPLFLLSLLAKETGALLLFVSVVYAGSFKRESFVRVASAAAVAVVAYLGLRVGVANLSSLEHDGLMLGKETIETKLLNLPMVLAYYLGKFVVPRDLATSQDWIVKTKSFEEFWLPLIGVASAALICGFHALRRWRSPFAFFFLWSVAGLGLHSHLVAPLDGTVAERWFYFTSMGLVGLCVALASACAKWNRAWSRVAFAASISIVVAFSVLSYQRARVWQDGYTLYGNDVKLQPWSPHLHNNYGVELYRRGQVAEAKVAFEKSIEINPNWSVSWNNLGAAHLNAGDLQRAERAFDQSLKLGPSLLAFQNYALVLVRKNRKREALEILEKYALPNFPLDPMLKELKAAAEAR